MERATRGGPRTDGAEPARGRRIARGGGTVLAIALAAMLAPAGARAQPEPPIEIGLGVYGWFPDISGRTRFTRAPGGGDFEVGIGDILDRLDFTFQGTFDLRRANWGLVADLVYMRLSDSANAIRDAAVGGVGLPVGASAAADLRLESRIVSVAGYHRAIDDGRLTLDVLGGVRHLDIDADVNWSISGNVGSIPLPGRAGSARASLGNLDAIVGLRGRYALAPGSPWFVPFLLDIGAGSSDFTWQAMAGIGYTFRRSGEIVATWRVLSYDLDSSEPITDLRFGGPLLGLNFRW